MAPYDETREIKGDAIIHPVFDTVLFKYLLDVPLGKEVASLELMTSGIDQNCELYITDEGNDIIVKGKGPQL